MCWAPVLACVIIAGISCCHPALPNPQQESTAGQRQPGGDWFNEAAAATGAVAGTPFETAFKSLQTAVDIMSWIAVEAEVRRAKALSRGRGCTGTGQVSRCSVGGSGNALAARRCAAAILPTACQPAWLTLLPRRRSLRRSGPRRCACRSALGRQWPPVRQHAPSAGWWWEKRSSTPQRQRHQRRRRQQRSEQLGQHASQPAARVGLRRRRRQVCPRRPRSGQATAPVATVAAAVAAAAALPPAAQAAAQRQAAAAAQRPASSSPRQ